MSILATIHQPSADLLFKFDRVISLAEGHTIYNGPPKLVHDYFKQYGFKPNIYSNPADKLSNIASLPWMELDEGTTILHIAKDTDTQY